MDSEDSDDDWHLEEQPLLVVEGPPVKAPLSDPWVHAGIGLWAGLGLSLAKLKAWLPWPVLEGRLDDLGVAVVFLLLGFAGYWRWDLRRTRRGGAATFFPGRVRITKHRRDRGRRVRYSRLRGYRLRPGFLVLVERSGDGLLDDLLELAMPEGHLTVPLPTAADAGRVTDLLERQGLHSLDEHPAG